MNGAYIISAVRTPIGRFGGSLVNHSPAELAAHAMRGALDNGKVQGENLDLYIFGNILRAGQGQLIPRQAALKAGIPVEVDGMAVDMVCSSGMMSVMTGSALIKTGDADIVLAGGTESMSGTGFYLTSRARWGYKFLLGAPENLVDLLLNDGLTDPITGDGMGSEAERLAAEHEITREELDEVAAMSHLRSAAATEKGYFESEIVPMEIKVKRDMVMLSSDEGIRADTTVASLAKLRPAFDKNGVLTAGNSSQISDGASAVLLASEDAVERYGLKPIARILGSAWSAGESWRFPEAPVPAVKKVLKNLKMDISDIDLFENNEAFAINSILFNRMLGVSYDVLNIHGGAIALGHPIGASGARIITTLIHALHGLDKQLGVAAICHGTGGGTTVVLERM